MENHFREIISGIILDFVPTFVIVAIAYLLLIEIQYHL